MEIVERGSHPGSDLIPLDADKIEKMNRWRKNSLIGNLNYLKREFHKMPIVEGWGSIEKGLKIGGAVGWRRGNMVLIDTDVWPGLHSQAVLDHELVEMAFDQDPSTAHRVLTNLGLSGMVQNHDANPNWDHYVATIAQLVKANELGILDEHMRLIAEYEERIGLRQENRRFRQSYRDKIAEIIIAHSKLS